VKGRKGVRRKGEKERRMEKRDGEGGRMGWCGVTFTTAIN